MSNAVASSPSTSRRQIEAHEIRAALSILRLLEIDGVEMGRAGRSMMGLCPFHSEKTPSFTWTSTRPHTVHCFGCGWHGDIFKYWMERRGVDFATANKELAAIAGFGGVGGGQRSEDRGRLKKKASVRAGLADLTHSSKILNKPRLPELRELREDEFVTLAHLRGLKIEALKVASDLGFLRAAMWPHWRPDAAPCWVITDNARNVAQFRRLDGKKILWRTEEQRAPDEKERWLKAWTKGAPSWPVGAANSKPSHRNIIISEGGADLLAVIQFLIEFQMIDEVLSWGILGASCWLFDEVVDLVRPKPGHQARRIRVMMHTDAPNKQTGLIPGDEAAKRWTDQLTHAGCAVESFRLPLIDDVKDVNDLARSHASAWTRQDIRCVERAFLNWDF